MPGLERVLALAPDRLALARGERGRGNRRRSRSRRSPSGTAGRCAAGSRARRAARHSGSVRKVTCAEDRPFALGDSASASASAAAHGVGQRAGAGEQARAGHRRERHRDLELGVVVAAGALEGFGPAVVEDVFAARMALHIAGRGAEQRRRRRVSASRWLRLPAGARRRPNSTASRADRKACETNGLSCCPRVESNSSSDVD